MLQLQSKTELKPVETLSPSGSPSKKHLLALTAFCITFFLLGLGGVGLIDGGEAFYGEGAREMMARREFLIPQLNYQPFYESPILVYWLQILSYRVFGVSEFATRLPSALFACALTFGTYMVGARLRNRNVGLMAALIVCTSPLMIALGRLGQPDIIFSALLSGAIFGLLARLKGASRQSMAVSYVCLGLAVLAKGPLAALIYIATVAIVLIATCKSVSEVRSQVAKLEVVLGTLATVAISLPWFIVVHNLTDGFWTSIYFAAGNPAKFLDGFKDVNPVSWNQFAIVAGAFLPWILFLPAAIKSALSVRPSASKADESRRYLVSWLSAVLIIAGFWVAKSPTCILPLLPVIALLVAYQFDDWINKAKDDLLISGYYRVVSLALAGVGIVMVFASALLVTEFMFPELAALPELFGAGGQWLVSRSPDWIKLSMVFGSFLVGVMLCWQFIKILSGKLQGSINTLFVSAVTMVAIASPIAFKLAYEYMDADLHRAIKVLVNKRDGQVAMFNDFMPSVMYYLGRPVDTFYYPIQLDKADSAPSAVAAGNGQPSKLYIISRISSVRPLVQGNELRVLARRGQWLVLEADGMQLYKLPELAEMLEEDLMPANRDHRVYPLASGGAQTGL